MNNEMDYKLYGLFESNKDINGEVYRILGECLVHLTLAKKTVTPSTIMTHLVSKIEFQPCDHQRKFYRVAIEIIGMAQKN
ncbi:hypothetical protein [Serratia quinivorans]|uniref:hypothetical protein n=1 Tax=Serratia TaxID=613 RepID=UPI00217C4EF7|nr:hypothetical protein [Serratia quinivorans]CAI0871705.1 Uncharacterised protein [Serratia quinivorans]CAI1603714.1 Uncharacterised protein [Serratia quinivorans]